MTYLHRASFKAFSHFTFTYNPKDFFSWSILINFILVNEIPVKSPDTVRAISKGCYDYYLYIRKPKLKGPDLDFPPL